MTRRHPNIVLLPGTRLKRGNALEHRLVLVQQNRLEDALEVHVIDPVPHELEFGLP